jgi:hypothetical protein
MQDDARALPINLAIAKPFPGGKALDDASWVMHTTITTEDDDRNGRGCYQLHRVMLRNRPTRTNPFKFVGEL